MRGQILNFSVQTNAGVISGDDGARYSFTGAGWQAPNPPRVGMSVDFEPDGGTATGIYAAADAVGVTSSVGSSVASPVANDKISTMGIAGMCAGVLAIVFFQTWVLGALGFLLMVVGLGLSITGLVTGRLRGEQVGFAIAGIALSSVPLVVNIFIAVVGTTLLNSSVGTSGGVFEAILKEVLPFV